MERFQKEGGHELRREKEKGERNASTHHRVSLMSHRSSVLEQESKHAEEEGEAKMEEGQLFVETKRIGNAGKSTRRTNYASMSSHLQCFSTNCSPASLICFPSSEFPSDTPGTPRKNVDESGRRRDEVSQRTKFNTNSEKSHSR